MNVFGSGISLIGAKIAQVASEIVTVRTGTVVSDYASMTQTMVTLDNDPDQSTVQALALNGPLPSGARVMMVAYPPRGLAIIGAFTEVFEPVMAPGDIIEILTSRSFAASEVAGASLIKVTCIGGGGAGGGTATTAGGSSAFGSGGSSGGLAIALLNVSALTFPITATVGAGGTGVNGGSGNAGAATTFATYCAASGGGGGQVSASSASPAVSAISSGPGVGTIGDILGYGNFGMVGLRVSATTGMAGNAGAGPYGGNVTSSNFTTAAGTPATAANGSGAGGGGAFGGSGAASQTGGVGASGSIWVEVIR